MQKTLFLRWSLNFKLKEEHNFHKEHFLASLNVSLGFLMMIQPLTLYHPSTIVSLHLKLLHQFALFLQLLLLLLLLRLRLLLHPPSHLLFSLFFHVNFWDSSEYPYHHLYIFTYHFLFLFSLLLTYLNLFNIKADRYVVYYCCLILNLVHFLHMKIQFQCLLYLFQVLIYPELCMNHHIKQTTRFNCDW